MIAKPWCERFVQRTAAALTLQVTAIGPTDQLRPDFNRTACVPTKESWLSRASDGRPVDPRKTKPGSPMPPCLGGGTGGESQSSCIGGLLGG